jgi:hypothetical protein
VVLREDRRARSALMDMHWTSAGWRSEARPPAGEDYRHAVDAGYLFEPVALQHDDVVDEITSVGAGVMAEAVDAFLASLTTRKVFLRSFLPSAVVASTLPTHGFREGPESGDCAICGFPEALTVDLNVLSFERHKWGGVRHLDLGFIWFCLDRLHVEGSTQPAPADRELLNTILDALRTLPPGVSATRAETALRPLRSNVDERRVVIETLSVCGVLQDPNHPGFLFDFVPDEDRELPGHRFAEEMGYPAAWWRSDHGVTEAAVTALFGSRP